MAKYRKKSIVIEAFQWTGGPDQTEDPEWIIEAIVSGDVWFDGIPSPNIKMMIRTLEGVMDASLGDYIIRGIEGEIYSCKPGIFEQTYEREVE